MENLNETNLREELKAQVELNKNSLPEEILKGNDSLVNELTTSEFRNKTLKLEDTVENFSLSDAFGKNISLESLLLKGPVVLTFYRGNWCPFCNIQLAALQRNIDDFKKLNTTLVAISAEKPDKAIVSVEKNRLTFPVLSDYKNVVAKKFGIIFQVPNYLIETYKKFGLDLENHYENQEILLPIPSTFVIDKQKKVKYVFSSEDFTQRAEPSEIIQALQKLHN